MSNGWMSVEDAAARLGRSPAHVRKLAREGALGGRQLAGVWALDEQAVAARAGQHHGPGRPLSGARAWMVLALLAHELDPDRPSPVVEDRRVRYQLRQLIDNAPPVESWNQWLRNRADPQRVWIHDGVLDELAGDTRVRPSGAYAAERAGTDLAGGPALIFYVDAGDVAALLADYHAQDDPTGPVLLQVIDADRDRLAMTVPPGGQPVDLALASLDLLESPAARERHVAVTALNRALSGARDALATAPNDG